MNFAFKGKLFLALFTICCLFSPVHAEIYKWVDDRGRVHYSDKPSEKHPVKKLDIKINSIESVTIRNIPGGASSSSAYKSKVTMYSTEWCVHCKRAKKYFKKNNIPFVEYDIEKSSSAKKRYDRLGGKGVPLIVAGRKSMSGFSPEGFQRIYQ